MSEDPDKYPEDLMKIESTFSDDYDFSDDYETLLIFTP